MAAAQFTTNAVDTIEFMFAWVLDSGEYESHYIDLLTGVEFTVVYQEENPLDKPEYEGPYVGSVVYINGGCEKSHPPCPF